MRKFLFTSLFAGALFILTLGFFQVQEALAIGPCDGICLTSQGVCNPARYAAKCYCPGTSQLTTCYGWCTGSGCVIDP
ncbi:MAG: hypothetical protein R6W90_03480 [Ignavibacteriaceae bacterium]